MYFQTKYYHYFKIINCSIIILSNFRIGFKDTLYVEIYLQSNREFNFLPLREKPI